MRLRKRILPGLLAAVMAFTSVRTCPLYALGSQAGIGGTEEAVPGESSGLFSVPADGAAENPDGGGSTEDGLLTGTWATPSDAGAQGGDMPWTSGSSAEDGVPEGDAPDREFYDAPTIDGLKKFSQDIAGAAVEFEEKKPFSLISMLFGKKKWLFDCYYVGEDDDYDVTMTKDFNLKYQMEFHASRDILPGDVEIRIQEELFKLRDGKSVLPNQIAVPETSGPEEHIETAYSPFNYYRDKDTGELVFFNYRKIESGTNAAWQVLYKGLKVMEITDETSWKLTPKVKVGDSTMPEPEPKPEPEPEPEPSPSPEVPDPIEPTAPSESSQETEAAGQEAADAGTDGSGLKEDTGSADAIEEGAAGTEGAGKAYSVPAAATSSNAADAAGRTGLSVPAGGPSADGGITGTEDEEPGAGESGSGPSESGPDEPETEPAPIPDPDPERLTADPLTGFVNTTATLGTVTKTPYVLSGHSYTPGIYTERQLKSVLGANGLPAKFSGDNFKNYKYAAWKIDISGYGTQPFDLWFKDSSTAKDNAVSGEVVGVCRASSSSGGGYSWTGTVNGAGGAGPEGYYASPLFSKAGLSSWRDTLYVVTAYDANQISAGVVMKNDVDVQLIPYDRKDRAQTKHSSAVWSYADYEWHYQGDIIGIKKGGGGTYPGWLDVYKLLRDRKRDLDVTFPFSTETVSRSFFLTHEIKGGKIGAWKTGMSTFVTSVDDALYAYPSNGTHKLLTGADYYFSDVSVTQRDYGYDIYEDMGADPVKMQANEGITVYAMYAIDGAGRDHAADARYNWTNQSNWETAGTVAWNEKGVMTYKFTEAQIKRKPYRVRVTHNTTNYSTTCDINVSVAIRYDSPAMKEILAQSNVTEITFENLSGVAGEAMKNNASSSPPQFYHDDTASGTNYSEPGIKEFTKSLYGTYLMRDNAFAKVQPVGKDANAYKASGSSNDVVNGKLNVTYSLAAYDGYKLANTRLRQLYEELVPEANPGRKEVVFYDLLPYGMKFDASKPVTAGRITKFGDGGSKPHLDLNSRSWDSNQVTVSAEVLDDNFNDTGRTMVAFTVKYSGADSSSVSGSMWFEAWGVSFQGYWDWKDIGMSDMSSNVCAFMPAASDNKALLGDTGQVGKDDGKTFPGNADRSDFEVFGPDIDMDGDFNEQTVLFAKNSFLEDSAVSSQSGIKKLVRSDSDMFGSYRESAAVAPGKGYTYDVTVTSATREMSNIIVFDRLENAAKDRASVSGELKFEDKQWQGTFLGVITEGLTAAGVKPTVYYNAARAAAVPAASATLEDAKNVLKANGWTEASQWKQKDADGNPAGVLAVALDLSKAADGSAFKLGPGESVSFQIKMKAPASGNGATWAYNNPSFFRTEPYSEKDTALVEGNSVKVRLAPANKLEVVKAFKNVNQVPTDRRDDVFTFELTENVGGSDPVKFANRRYTLWQLNGKTWTEISDGQIHATDMNGTVKLKAGQKAVFEDIPAADSISVKEKESIFWETETEAKDANGVRTVTVRNIFRPPLYVQKKLQSTPGGSFTGKDDVFTFQLFRNGKPAAGVPYWYVDRVYGGTPKQATGHNGGHEGKTDAEGKFKIYADEIIALFPGVSGDSVKIAETGKTENWICQKDNAETVLSTNGVSLSITNIYKWRDLLLSKKITNQDTADAKDVELTFRIEEVINEGGKETYKPVVGNKWVLLENGKDSPTEGTLSEAGEFKCNLAGKTVRIEKLVAGTSYRVAEVSAEGEGHSLIGARYSPVSDTEYFQAQMFVLQSNVAITNDWMLRPLAVKKIVAYDPDDDALVARVRAAEFKMIALAQPDDDFDGVPDEELKPLTGHEVTIMQNGKPLSASAGGSNKAEGGKLVTGEDGSFYLKDGQTAIIKDAGLPGARFKVSEEKNGEFVQIYPLDDAPVEGEVEAQGTEAQPVSFINGMSGIMMFRKEYTGNDETGTEFVEIGKAAVLKPEDERSADEKAVLERLKVDFSLTAVKASGESVAWPTRNTLVNVIDDSGTMTEVLWNKGRTLSIYPWQSVILTGGLGDGYESYSLSESAEDRHWMYQWTKPDGSKAWLENAQQSPAKDASAGGYVDEAPVVTVVNGISAPVKDGSKVRKRMVMGSDEVPEGSRLFFKVERYSGTSWKPAAGIAYLSFDGAGITCDRTLYSDSDGYICLTKTDSGYPWVQFLTDDVKLPPDAAAPTAGMLRVTEDLETSDPDWGTLAWYGAWDGDQEYNAHWAYGKDVDYKAFVNTNHTEPVRIGKRVGETTDADFTMTLLRITGIDWTKTDNGTITADNYEEAITERIPWSGLSYDVYEMDDGGRDVLIETRTCSDGKIRLKAGQYAEVQLPVQTYWTVAEETIPGFTLKSMERRRFEEFEESDKLTRLGPNLMLISLNVDFSPSMKYAVAVYGIKQDVDEDGNIIGLTFGPATGESYIDSSKSCGSEHCIHDMGWAEIIEHANTDPEIFEQCLRNGCTKSVDLDLTGKKFAAAGYADGSTKWTGSGNGASVLYDSIARNYRKWNSSNSNAGGWPTSRMRATLNGKENCSGLDAAVAGTDCLPEQQALISAFPAELQAAIVPKAVKSDTKYDDLSSYNVTTYDRLWLFSGKEIYVYVARGSNNAVIRNNEGTLCSRASELGITTDDSVGNKAYNESGSAVWRWLRSPNRGSGSSVYYVNYSGDWYNVSAGYADNGVAPGFCLGSLARDPHWFWFGDDKTLVLKDGAAAPGGHGDATASGRGLPSAMNASSSGVGAIGWSQYRGEIETVIVADGVKAPGSMAYWFYNASKLKTLKGLEKLDTSDVTNMDNTFNGCSGITDWSPLSKWDTAGVASHASTFTGCTGALPAWGTNWK